MNSLAGNINFNKEFLPAWSEVVKNIRYLESQVLGYDTPASKYLSDTQKVAA